MSTDEPRPAEAAADVPKPLLPERMVSEQEYRAYHAKTFDQPERLVADLALWRVMRTRPGWRTGYVGEHGGDVWTYDLSFGGRHLLVHDLLDKGLVTLRVGIQPDRSVRIGHCGVHTGCAQHAVREDWCPVDAPKLPDLLDAAERAAREIDRDAVAGCLVWGECGMWGTERFWWGEFGEPDATLGATDNAEADYAAETTAMNELAAAGFQLVHADGPVDAPERLTYVRTAGERADFVYLALNEGAYSMAARYPLEAAPTTFAEASGEHVPPAEETAKPGSIVDVIAEVLRWSRG
ncbi:hypothetical protein [Amycolatopsis saalfeldensis]|uniref:Uncharacterized protein n=1 Tax=Amycolatopsis saalfeldensis TaxID=394193 RepID=A0A1H8YPM3_9PSEU|nr:hypothetical protein [Amycolatopsis saalfeldensis]SEP54079.1 hypothetical protein SAMN04489732_13636 [Amycolatopsis saalfeldensis]